MDGQRSSRWAMSPRRSTGMTLCGADTGSGGSTMSPSWTAVASSRTVRPANGCRS